MKNDFSNQSINSKKEIKTKKDKTLYEKLVIIGDKEVGKSSLIQNIFSQESISIISDSLLSVSATNIMNNENTNKNNSNINNNNQKNSKGIINNSKNENDTIDKNDSNNKIKEEDNLINDIISEQKISIKNENRKVKNLQIIESSFSDNNFIHSLAFMCQCILVVFDIKNINSFEKSKKIIYNLKSEIKIQKPFIILVSTKNDQDNNDKNENKNIDNNIIMNFIDKTIQNNIDNDLNEIIVNNYIEVSNITKKGISELKTEILNSYEKETILLLPLTLSLNQDYNKYKQNNNIYDILDNNINQINWQINSKKKSSSTSTKSKSSKENISNNNNDNSNFYIKTYSPKILFKLEDDNNKENNVTYITSLMKRRTQSQIKEKYCDSIKIILLGDSLVGKTSFINQFFSEGFNPNLTSTIGINERSKIINYNEKFYKIQIWDTAGQERFESIPKQYYERMEGVFLFYDITNERSFDNMLKWLKDIYECGNEHLVIYILGNKVDLIEERKISYLMGKNFAKQKNMKFMEISCKLDLNISDVIYCMIYDILRIENEYKNDNFSLCNEVIEYNNESNNNINRNCCY